MMALPQVAGIIDGAVTITVEPDGRVSFRVLVSANGGQPDGGDRIELIIDPEHVRQALAGTEIHEMADEPVTDELSTFPCHIGFSASAT